MKGDYLTEEEKKMPNEMKLLQYVLGIQSCKTKGDVLDILGEIQRDRDAELIKAVTELPEWDLENVSAALISKKEVLELIKGGKG